MLDQAISPHNEASDRRRRAASENDALVMTQIRRANRPVSAYDIAERVSRIGSVMVPNQVYRTLARLMDQGRVVRIESLAAYFPAQEHADICLICIDCHWVSFLPAPHVLIALRRLSQAHGHSGGRTIVEMHGRCAECVKLAAVASSNSH